MAVDPSVLSHQTMADHTAVLRDVTLYQSNDPELISTQLDEALAAETARRRQFDEDFDRLRRHRDALLNARLSVGLLPIELLQDVFLLVYAEVANAEERPHAGWSHMKLSLHLSHVCRVWRAAAFATPTLWASITILDSGPNSQITKMFLERSDTRLLDINLAVTQFVEAARLLLTHLDRWRIVRMRLKTFKLLREFMEQLNRTIPQLESMDLNITALSTFAPVNLSLPPALHAPHLSCLTLDNGPILRPNIPANSAFPVLQQLSLSKSAFEQYFSSSNIGTTLGRLAASFPQLSNIALSGSRTIFASDDSGARASPRAPFPALEKITLDLDTSTIHRVLRALFAPHLRTIALIRLNAAMPDFTPSQLAEFFPALSRIDLSAPRGRVFYAWLAPFSMLVRTVTLTDADINGLLQAVRAGAFPRLEEMHVVFSGAFNYLTLRTLLRESESLVHAVRMCSTNEPRQELRAWFEENLKAFEWEKWTERDPQSYVELTMTEGFRKRDIGIASVANEQRSTSSESKT